MYRNKLFAGFCSTSGTSSDTLLAKWDGKNWTRIEGPNQGVRALCEYQDELYVGGYFTMIAQDSMIAIARYSEPPDTTCDFLQAIIHPKNAVLKISDSTIVHFYNNIIHGSSWHWDFGDGGTDTVRMPVHTYASAEVYNVSVIVTYQNCKDTAYTTVTIVDDAGIKENKNDSIEYLGNNIPNPFNNTTTIPYYVPNGSKGSLQITDANGKLVKEYALQQGKNTLEVTLKNFNAGTYFYSIVIDGKDMQTKKMILQ
jgi:PKD repeat protein